MARLPIVSADMVPEEFREAFAEVTAPAGGSITGGPGSFTINSPEMAKRRNHLTSYLRYETKFPKRIQELAILTAARAMDCQYVWNAWFCIFCASIVNSLNSSASSPGFNLIPQSLIPIICVSLSKKCFAKKSCAHFTALFVIVTCIPS